jgi:APA family basic amino acid/polyamine antiporter
LVFAGIISLIFFGLTSEQSEVGRIFDTNSSNNTPITFSAIFAAMLAAFWAYQGWATIGFIGGEIKNAHRIIPLGITIGVFIVITLYLLVNSTYLSLLPVETLEKIHQSGNKIAAVEAARAFGGSGGAFIISILIMITTLGATNACILVSCRPYYAMAKEDLFFRNAARLNEKQVPAYSLWYQGIWACILVLSGSFDQLTDMIIFAVFIFYMATAMGVFILRKRMPNAPRPYKVWAYPVVPAIVILFSAALVMNTFFSRPREAAIGVVLMLTAVPMYWWFTKKKNLAEPETENQKHKTS